MTPLRVGVIGAGRVGAVLAAALRSRGHEIVSVAGESDASHRRIHDLLPGVTVAKPTAVARSCDVLLLTVPDDMLDNVVTQLAASGALHAGQYVVHTSGSHGLRGARPRPPGRRPPGRPAPGDDLHRHRPRPRPARRLRLRRDRRRRRARVGRGARRRARRPDRCGSPRSTAASTTPGSRTAPTTSSPWSPRRWSCSAAAGADDPAAILRPLLEAALDNALTDGDAALTGPIVRGDVNTVRAHLAEIAATAPDTLPSYVALAQDTLDRVVTDGRVLPIRAATHPPACSTRRWPRAERTPAVPPRRRPCDDPRPAPRVDARGAVRRARAAPRRAGEPVALVPTMGALHEGHAALFRAARVGAGDGPGGRVDLRQPAAVRARARTSTATRAPSTTTSSCVRARASTSSSRPRSTRSTPAGDPLVTVEPGPLAADARGRVAARPLPRRAHRGRQAVRADPARPRRLRREGLPAAGADPADEPRPLPGRRRASACRPCARPTAWRSRAATATSIPTNGVPPRSLCPAPCAARRRAARRGAEAARAAAAAELAGEPRRASTTSRCARRTSVRVGPTLGGPVEARILVAARVGTTRLIDNLPLTLGER